MSMVYIYKHDESIYNVEKKEKPALKKPPLYHSKFQSLIHHEKNANKDDHRTMGYPEIPLNPPGEFLIKGGGVKCIRPKTVFSCNQKRPPVPKRNENGKIDHKDTNWKAENIRRVVSAAPRKVNPRYADTKNGDFHDLKSSGLMPVYIYQEKFGKCPKYLLKRKMDLINQRELSKDEESRKQPMCRYITQEERAALLGGLKQNWVDIQIIYQGLPVLTDTIPKMHRKTKLENELKQLEKDILLVENHPYIYIYKGDQQMHN